MLDSTRQLLAEARDEGYCSIENNAGTRYALDDVIDGLETINDYHGLVRIGQTSGDNEPYVHCYTDRGYIGQRVYTLIPEVK